MSGRLGRGTARIPNAIQLASETPADPLPSLLCCLYFLDKKEVKDHEPGEPHLDESYRVPLT